MDQNQTVDNDLQKAIDDITKVGPFPEPKVEMVAPAPEPIAPFEPIDIPELNVPAPEPAAMPPMPQPAPEPAAMPPMPQPAPEPVTLAPAAPEPTLAAPEPAPAHTQSMFNSSNLNTRQVKEAALRDLIPLLDRLNMTPSQKFNICRNIFEDLRDYTVLEQAYRAATEIANETERAEALLYLVESIDKM